MRDIISCFSESSIDVSNASCSSYSSNACISPNLTPSVQNTVTSLYRITLSTHGQVLITVTWCKTNHQSNHGLSIGLCENPSMSLKLNSNSRLFKKKKGSKVLESSNLNSKIEVFWDLSAARYGTAGPEPIEGYYVLVLVESQVGLILGDMPQEAVTRKIFKNSGKPMAKTSMLARQEYFSGNTLYVTRARFSETGVWHDIVIRYSGEVEGLKHPVLSVYIDKKSVIKIKRLQWNFRGNHTLFVDGLLVDMMWDVHDWFFNPSSCCGVFMLRTRSGLDSRLWLEEKFAGKEHDKGEFSLLIYACKTL